MRTDLLGAFMEAWVSLERGLSSLAERERSRVEGADQVTAREHWVGAARDSARLLQAAGFLSEHQVEEIDRLRQIRNEVVHG